MRRMSGVGVTMALLGFAGCTLTLDVDVPPDGAVVVGSGTVVKDVRPVGGFHGVLVDGGIHVRITRTGRERVELTGDDNLLPHVRTDVRDGLLRVGPVPGVELRPTGNLLVVVEAGAVDRIDSSGASALDVDVGAVRALVVSLSGATTMTAKGSSDRLHLVLSGASVFHGADFCADSADVIASGASSVLVGVKNRLRAWVSGASSVRYIGNPDVESSVSGASSIGAW